MRTKNTVFRPTDSLDIAPSDAQHLGLPDGASVRLRSRYGEVVLPLHFNDAVLPGQLFTTFHTMGVLLNQVTSTHRDEYAGAPEYKVTAVRVDQV